MGTLGPPIYTILEGFYSTVVLNILTWDKAYSIFALPSFIQHRAYLLRDLSNSHESLIEKYERRGWTMGGIMRPEDHCSNHPIRPSRRIGDNRTWMIPFDITNMKHSQPSDSVLWSCDFSIENTGTHQPVNSLPRLYPACKLHYTIQTS